MNIMNVMLMSKCCKYAVRHKILVERSMYREIRSPVRDGISVIQLFSYSVIQLLDYGDYSGN